MPSSRAGRPRSHVVLLDPRHCLRHQIRESSEGDELTGSEKVSKGGQAVAVAGSPSEALRNTHLRPPLRPCLPSYSLMSSTVGARYTRPRFPSATIAISRAPMRSGLAFRLDVVARNGCTRHQAPKVRPSRQLGPRLRRLHIRRHPHLHRKPISTPLYHRLDIRLLPLLGRKHEGRSQRHVDIRKRRVGTLHRTCPEPGDHRQLAPLIRLEVGPLPYHLFGNRDLGIQMPDAFFRLVTHPLAVVADVLRQPLRSLPLTLDQRRLA